MLGRRLQTDDDVIKLDGSEIRRARVLGGRTCRRERPAGCEEGKQSWQEGHGQHGGRNRRAPWRRWSGRGSARAGVGRHFLSRHEASRTLLRSGHHTGVLMAAEKPSGQHGGGPGPAVTELESHNVARGTSACHCSRLFAVWESCDLSALPHGPGSVFIIDAHITAIQVESFLRCRPSSNPGCGTASTSASSCHLLPSAAPKNFESQEHLYSG